MTGLFHATARRTDPATSHAAAARVNASGSASTHAEQILGWVRFCPGQTSAEIAQATGLERHEAARRCSDLARAGLIHRRAGRVCTLSRKSAATWWPGAEGGGA